MKNPLIIGTLVFPTRRAATEHFRALLARYRDGDTIDAPDTALLHALIERHAEAAQKVGCGIRRFYRDMTDKGTSCFWLERIDGTTTDFSLHSCIRGRAKSREQEFREACRETVAEDLIAARRAHFEQHGDHCGRVPCDITGEPLYPDEAHIDHKAPMTFEVIVRTFSAMPGNAPSRAMLSPSQDRQFTTTLTDPNLERRFRNYHYKVDVLRIIRAELNLELGAQHRIQRPRNPVRIPVRDSGNETAFTAPLPERRHVARVVFSGQCLGL